MDPARELGKWLLFVGLGAAAVGGILLLSGRLPLRLGRLPGDIAVQGRRGGFYFPVVSCLLLSAGLTLLMWLVRWLRR